MYRKVSESKNYASKMKCSEKLYVSNEKMNVSSEKMNVSSEKMNVSEMRPLFGNTDLNLFKNVLQILAGKLFLDQFEVILDT